MYIYIINLKPISSINIIPIQSPDQYHSYSIKRLVCLEYAAFCKHPLPSSILLAENHFDHKNDRMVESIPGMY